MINEPVNQRHMSDNPVASARMTTQSRPPGLAAKTAERTSLGHRFQRALAGGPNRRFPWSSPLSRVQPFPFPFLNRRLAFPILAILALLAASLLFLLPGGPLHAQEAAIQYPENDTGAVATYTAVDPEGAAVKWSLAGLDAGDFSIDGGVLAFKKSPNYEKATGGGSEMLTC